MLENSGGRCWCSSSTVASAAAPDWNCDGRVVPSTAPTKQSPSVSRLWPSHPKLLRCNVPSETRQSCGQSVCKEHLVEHVVKNVYTRASHHSTLRKCHPWYIAVLRGRDNSQSVVLAVFSAITRGEKQSKMGCTLHTIGAIKRKYPTTITLPKVQ